MKIQTQIDDVQQEAREEPFLYNAKTSEAIENALRGENLSKEFNTVEDLWKDLESDDKNERE